MNLYIHLNHYCMHTNPHSLCHVCISLTMNFSTSIPPYVTPVTVCSSIVNSHVLHDPLPQNKPFPDLFSLPVPYPAMSIIMSLFSDSFPFTSLTSRGYQVVLVFVLMVRIVSVCPMSVQTCLAFLPQGLLIKWYVDIWRSVLHSVGLTELVWLEKA